MKKINLIGSIIVVCFFLFPNVATSQTNEYINRFTTLRNKIKDPSNGYFSKDGVPYHSVESLICEAPDHGHETTSEAYSYWIWLEAMQGRVAKDWAPLNSAWTKMETLAIPTNDLQPTAGAYKPNAPATYASEFPLPSNYPSPLQTSVPVGQDPVSPELTATYGNSFVYGMHWLFDLDNFYGYGNKGDGVSTPSYINTFQRGVQESVWETVPQPTWDDFKWGKPGSGFLNLFTSDPNPPSKQWKYTNAPDADARVVQAMYWATLYAKEQGLNPATVMPLGKTKKMGDYLRLAMFDKYFKPMGVQNVNGAGGTGYQSAHYLLAWYYAWGGPLTENGWAWRIGCSHSHFGYQNPVAAYALSAVPELIPASPNASRDWGTSLTRQMEFYQWLQSAEGAIAGGATNSWNGKYDPYPAGTPTFYNMAYVENPVYEDPGSNTWFGMQAWSMERVAEYYYMTGNARAKTILDKWVTWVKSVTRLLPNGSYEIPAEIGWTGKPNTWTPASPTVNTGLHVTVVTYNQDVGIAACLAKALTYYAAGTQKHATLDVASRDLAKAILDRMWTNFYEPTGKGVAAAETRTDFRKFFEQEVYIPAGWTGTMPNGDVIQPGVKFIDIRSKYKQDPDWARLQAAYTAGTGFTQKYHRFWAQADVALANAEYGYFFGGGGTVNVPPTVSLTAPANNASFTAPASITITASAADSDGTVASVQFFNGTTLLGTDATAPYSFTWAAVPAGTYTLTAVATDNVGAATTSVARTVTVTGGGGNLPPTVSLTAPANNATFTAPASITITATAADSDGTVANVQFFNGTTLLGSDATAPYSFTWTAVPAGTYTITARATDNIGAMTTSTARTITVTGGGNIPPTVSITAPANNATFTAPASITITASAADTDGTVANVQFFNGATLLGSDATAPYSFTWAGVGVGTYTITARATDNAGASTTSTAITVTVTSGGGTSCAFGTPLAAGLPSTNASYNRVHKLGTGGPNLSNVTNFTINWNLQQNGLWQLSFNTNNGNPTWWLDLRSVSTTRFNVAQPDITFTNSGFPGLDGSYYVGLHNGNFVLASKTGGFTLYFSNSATPPVCTSARLGAEEMANMNAVSAFPNPFSEVFNISIEKPELVKALSIHDQVGRLVVNVPREEIKSNVEIRQPMRKGLYILKVQSTYGSQTIKIIKE